MESGRLPTRLGPLAWQSRGRGPALVFFAGALAHHGLWRDVTAALEDRYRCVSFDLPLGAHPWPLVKGADRSARSLARLLLDCLELQEIDDATLVANDTAGGLLLLALATRHPALERVSRIVLTNCESYDQFPPDALRGAAALCRTVPPLARGALRLQARLPAVQRRAIAAVAATGLDPERAASFSAPARRDPRVAGDLVAALAGFHPELLVEAAEAIPRFDRPVLLAWGDACRFFPLAHAHRLAADFPDATLVPIPGARTWVPVDAPTALAIAIADFVPRD